MADDEKRSSRIAKKCAQVSSIIIKQEIRARMKQVNYILKKPVEERTSEELVILDQSPDIADAVQKRSRHRQLAKERVHEIEDPHDVLLEKCEKLADAIRNSENLVIYTGAGISTAASIPDYRGPNGVWTLLQKGVAIKPQDLSDAEPTFTHMSISRLYKEGKVKHVVSQNCDGLHLRSGFPRHKLSEVHGNMYIELCNNCKPLKEYIRLFDVTERTGMRRHRTGRMCHSCGEGLRDTIIHFGEKAPFTSPYNWEEAAEAVDEADLVLCLGSSLKVLKKYGCLWNLHKPQSKRPKLFIANLQWTPKDDAATVKINGKCDRVIEIVMSKLGYEVPCYNRLKDPIYKMATELLPAEVNSTSKKILQKNKCLEPLQKFQAKEELKSTSSDATSSLGTALHPAEHVKNEPGSTECSAAEQIPSVDDQSFLSTQNNLDMIKALLRNRIIEKTSVDPSTQYAPAQTSSTDSMTTCQVKTEIIPNLSVSSPISGKYITSSTVTTSQSAATSQCSPGLLESYITEPIEYACQANTLCSSEVMNHLGNQTHLDGDMTNSKPSDKYKLIKYLLNKPADVTDEKLKQFTEKLRDMCDSATLGELASECQSRLIYTTADSLKYRPSVQPGSQGHSQKSDQAPLSKSYPTLIGALKGLVQMDAKCSVSVGQLNTSVAHPNPAVQKSLGFPPSSSSAQSLGPLSIDVGSSPGTSTPRSLVGQGGGQLLGQSGLLRAAAPSSDFLPVINSYISAQGTQVIRPEDQTSLMVAHQIKRSASTVETMDADITDAEQAENISPVYSGSAPGWFGKGLNIKKRKKKSR